MTPIASVNTCDSPSQVVSYIKENAASLAQEVKSTEKHLIETMDAITALQTSDQILNISSLFQNMHAIKRLLFQHNQNLEQHYENLHMQKDIENKIPFKDSEEYKKIVANSTFLGKLFSDFFHTNNTAFTDRAVANPGKRSILAKLLKYDSVGKLGGNMGELPLNQRRAKRGIKNYTIIEHLGDGTITETAIPDSL